MTRSIWGGEYGAPAAYPVRRGRRLRGIGWIALLALIGLAVAGLWAYGSRTPKPFWGVQRIHVSGNRAVAEAELLAGLGLSEGMPWWTALRELGETDTPLLPRLARAEVSYAPPAGLRVVATERRAVLLFADDPTIGLAEDGTVVSLAAGFDPIDLPYLTGPLPSCRPGSRFELCAAGDWWAALSRVRAEQPDLWNELSQIDYRGGPDFVVYFRDRYVLLWDSRRNGHLWTQVPLVLSRLRMDALGGDAVLDLRFRDQIVVRVPEGKLEEEQPEQDEGPDEGLRQGVRSEQSAPRDLGD
jgi:hypothetical protein